MTNAHQVDAKANAEIRARIIRADGTVEDLGVVDATYKNPLRQTWWRLIGKPRANRRIARANRQHARRQRHEE